MDRERSKVVLEPASIKRRAEFLRLSKASSEIHDPWVQAPASGKEFAAYLARSRRKSSRCYFVCRRADRRLVGVINITQIIRGFFQSAFLGYYVFKPFARSGYMTEALSLALDEAFSRLDLHRLEANIQPGNRASRKLVRRLGFRLEGFSPRYLQVKGEWRDHERWAMTREDWEKS